MPRAVWTDAQVAQMSEMWLAGVPIIAIARALNYTRNAVIGKAFRLGLPCHVPSAASIAERRERRAEASRAAAAARAAMPKEPRGLVKRQHYNPRPPTTGPVSLLRATNDQCRFPLWADHAPANANDHLVCGAGGCNFIGGRPYCAKHAKVAFARSPRETPLQIIERSRRLGW